MDPLSSLCGQKIKEYIVGEDYIRSKVCGNLNTEILTLYLV